MSERAAENDRILRDEECGEIVRVSIAADRLFNGPDGDDQYGPDPLLLLVESIVRERMAQAWEDGYCEAISYVRSTELRAPVNPYRSR